MPVWNVQWDILKSATRYSLVQCDPTTGPRTACGPPKHSEKNLQIWRTEDA